MYMTHGQRAEKNSNFGQCVVLRWVCVNIRYSFVERAGPTLCIRCHALCASRFLCMHKNVRQSRRMNVYVRRTLDTRRARWTNAVHSLGVLTYALYAHCLRPVYARATCCAFVVKLASFSQILTEVGRTTTH